MNSSKLTPSYILLQSKFHISLSKKVERIINIHPWSEEIFHSLSSEFHSILTPVEWKFTTQRSGISSGSLDIYSKRSDHWRQYPRSENRVNTHSLFLDIHSRRFKKNPRSFYFALKEIQSISEIRFTHEMLLLLWRNKEEGKTFAYIYTQNNPGDSRIFVFLPRDSIGPG